jgi:hypothetical protein
MTTATANETTSNDTGIGRRLHDAGDRVVEVMRIDSIGALMKKHPFAALGIGFGLGYLIARVLHR